MRSRTQPIPHTAGLQRARHVRQAAAGGGPRTAQDPDIDNARRKQYASLLAVDDAVKEIFQTLQSKGLLDKHSCRLHDRQQHRVRRAPLARKGLCLRGMHAGRRCSSPIPGPEARKVYAARDQRRHRAYLRRARRRRSPARRSTDAASSRSSRGSADATGRRELFHFRTTRRRTARRRSGRFARCGTSISDEATGEVELYDLNSDPTRCRASPASRSTRRSSPRWQGGWRRCEPLGHTRCALRKPRSTAAHGSPSPGAVHVPFERARIGLPVPAGCANVVGELHVAEDVPAPERAARLRRRAIDAAGNTDRTPARVAFTLR